MSSRKATFDDLEKAIKQEAYQLVEAAVRRVAASLSANWQKEVAGLAPAMNQFNVTAALQAALKNGGMADVLRMGCVGEEQFKLLLENAVATRRARTLDAMDEVQRLLAVASSMATEQPREEAGCDPSTPPSSSSS